MDNRTEQSRQPEPEPQRPPLYAYGSDVVQAQLLIENNGW
jgi:hypothetical protein